MVDPLSYLPVEILTVIADQLDDQASCRNVNRQWYLFFRRYLYKSIYFKSYQQFNTFVHHFCHQGKWVKEIVWNDQHFSLDDQIHILNHCPNIHRLHFRFFNNTIQKQKQPIISDTLHHLTLCYQQQQKNNDDDDDDDEDYYDQKLLFYGHNTSLLKYIPFTLRSLTLNKIFRGLNIDHLLNIHQVCPTLTQLNLSVEFLCHLPRQTNFNIQQYKQLNNNNHYKMGGKLSLQQLTIQTGQHYGYHAIMTSGWLQYILTTYPHLDRLKLGYIAPGSSPISNNVDHVFIINDDDDDDDDVVLTKFGFTINHLRSIQNPLACFISCLQSKILNQQCTLYNTSGTTTTHDQQHLISFEENSPIKPSEFEDVLTDAPVDVFNIHIKFDTQQRQRLIALDLIESSKQQFPHRLNIDMLLTQLSFLRQFHATGVSLERGKRQQIEHPLVEMKLTKSWICDAALDSMIQRCPTMKQLALLDCHVLCNQPSFQLRMPYHVMQSIVLEKISLMDYFGLRENSLALVQLFTLDALPRFFMVEQQKQLLENNNNRLNYCYPSIIQCQSLDQFIVK